MCPLSSATCPRYLRCPCSVVYASNPLWDRGHRLAERMLEPDPSALHTHIVCTNSLCKAPVTAYVQTAYVRHCLVVRAGPEFFLCSSAAFLPQLLTTVCFPAFPHILCLATKFSFASLSCLHLATLRNAPSSQASKQGSNVAVNDSRKSLYPIAQQAFDHSLIKSSRHSELQFCGYCTGISLLLLSWALV